MPVSKNCECCGNTFSRPPSVAMKAKYCSKHCADHSQRSLERKSIVCETCHAAFTAVQDHGKWPKFCCRQCFEHRNSSIHKRSGQQCAHCGSTFLVEKSGDAASVDKKYCGRLCLAAARKHANEKTCECCGVVFVKSDSRLRDYNVRFCSRKCSTSFMVGERSSGFSGGHYLDTRTGTNRILLTYATEGERARYIGEHRLIASKIIGRPLSAAERILHLNGINNDNRPENLFICTSIGEMGKRVFGRLPWPKKSNLDSYR